MNSEEFFHIAFQKDWAKAQEIGQYHHPSIEQEGFIHCSYPRQIAESLNKHFPKNEKLVLLEIDAQKLKSELKIELAASRGEDFPHIYGPLNVDAVSKIHEIKWDGEKYLIPIQTNRSE